VSAASPAGVRKAATIRHMRVTAKVDYALRAAAELAAAAGAARKREAIAGAQGIPVPFLEQILLALKRAGIVRTRRGPEGGYWLARDPDAITLAEVIRAVEGPLANVQGERPEDVEYTGAATPLQDVWIAVRANLRAVLDEVTLADLAANRLPPEVIALTEDPAAWEPR
jgi:Rrf2 family protein